MDTFHIALAAHGNLDEPATRLAIELHRGQFFLHLLHAGLHLADLLHHAHDVFHP